MFHLVFQLRIVAFDSANPNQKVTTVVSIKVTRNENGPIYTRNTYSVHASETMDLGGFITQVNATDRDGVRSLIVTVFYKLT